MLALGDGRRSRLPGARNAAFGRSHLTEVPPDITKGTWTSMKPRVVDRQHMGGLYEQMHNLETYIGTTDLERSLIHLVKLRASQING